MSFAVSALNFPEPRIVSSEIVDGGVVDQPLGDGLDQLELAPVAVAQVIQVWRKVNSNPLKNTG